MRISPVNNTSFGKLVIDDKDGKTTEAFSLVAKYADNYGDIKSAFDKIDKNTGSDTVVLSGEVKEHADGDPRVRLTIKNAEDEELSTFYIDNINGHYWKYEGIQKRPRYEYNEWFHDIMESFAGVPGYKPSSESIKCLASQYIK